MDIKCIFVGDEPNRGAKSKTPFVHAKCAERLSAWIDYLVGDEDYVIVNQCDYEDYEIFNLWMKYDYAPFVFLGNKARDKFENYMYQYAGAGFKLPHPSGKNRQLNNKAKLFLKLRECKAYLGR